MCKRAVEDLEKYTTARIQHSGPQDTQIKNLVVV